MLKWWRLLREYWDGVLILMLATWLRLISLPDPFFITDQGRALLAGRAILQGNFLLGGPQTSVSGISLGPFYYYFSALGLLVSQYEVWGPTLAVAFVNIVGVGLVWVWLRKYWGQNAALSGAGVLAVSALAAQQAQIALEPSPLPFVTALWLWSLSRLTYPNLLTARRWWVATWLSVLISVQLNASAVILVAVTATYWFWQSRFRHRAKHFWQLALGGLAGLSIGKALLWGSTPVWYWWKSWQEFASADSLAIAVVLLIVLVTGLCAWIQRHRFPLPSTDQQSRLLWILGVWGSWSLIAFSLKTVTGDHAFNLWFVWGAAVLGITLQTIVKHQWNSFFVCITCGFLLWQGFGSAQRIQSSQHPRVSDHLQTIKEVSNLAEGKPYALLYTGHLDIYEAADDHLQYLLWQQDIEPVTAARIAFDKEHPEYCERWLEPHTTLPALTITLAVPVQGDPKITAAPAPTFLCQ